MRLCVHAQEAHTNTSSITSCTGRTYSSHFTSHHIRHVIIFCRGHTGKCCLLPVHLNPMLHCTSVWLLPLSLFHIGLIRILLTSHFHPSVFLSLTECSCQTCRSTLHKLFICPSYVAYVRAATLRWVEFVPRLLTTEEVSVRLCASHTNMHRHSEARTQTETHKSVFSFSTCDLC